MLKITIKVIRDSRFVFYSTALILFMFSVYQIKQEYTSEGEGERQRKMADLAPRKFEVGIGPTTRDGMPLVLRSVSTYLDIRCVDVLRSNCHHPYKNCALF